MTYVDCVCFGFSPCANGFSLGRPAKADVASSLNIVGCFIDRHVDLGNPCMKLKLMRVMHPCLSELPKIKPFSEPRRYLTQGYPASFICKATGVPAPKCKWLSPDGNQINSIGNVQVSGCNLTFTSVDELFTKGKYTCVAYIEIEETGEEIGQASAIVEVVDVFGKDHLMNEVFIFRI